MYAAGRNTTPKSRLQLLSLKERKRHQLTDVYLRKQCPVFSVNKLDVKAQVNEYSFELKGLQVLYRAGLG